VFAGWCQEDDRHSVLLHDVLRGIKMATIIEGHAPSASGFRSGILPPISRDEPPETSNNNNNNNINNSNNNSINVRISFGI